MTTKITVSSDVRFGKESRLLVVPVYPPAKKAKPQSGKGKAPSKPGWTRFDPSVTECLKALDHDSHGAVLAAVTHHDFSPGAGKRLDVLLDDAPHLLRLSGLSAAAPKGLEEWRKVGGDLIQHAKRLKVQRADIDLHHVPTDQLTAIVQAVVEGLRLGAYEFTTFKGKRPTAAVALSGVSIVVPAKQRKAVELAIQTAEVIAQAVAKTRDLTNTPPSDLRPKALLQHARQIASSSRGRVSIKSFNRAQLKRMGAGALLGVARGSDAEPFLLHLAYRPKKRTKDSKRIVLIGKGVTFDSGGLSIKTGKGMEDMKCDMAGAACVISTIEALAALSRVAPCIHEVHALVPTTENMINGESMKPGDVLRAMNGKTIEVLNTDAEGRLILADALSYAERLKGDLIVDLATLTGACVVALGSDYAGLFSTSDSWTEVIQRSAARVGERLWRLPLADEYRPQLESDVADLRNIGTGGPGAILGALFLKEFVPGGTPWIHLDIAGPAFGPRSNEYLKRGSTGFGVLTLVDMLLSSAS